MVELAKSILLWNIVLNPTKVDESPLGIGLGGSRVYPSNVDAWKGGG
jgi:hypothetical protein